MRKYLFTLSIIQILVVFTGSSQTLEWETPAIDQVNEESFHSTLVHYPNALLALKFDKKQSPWVLMLNGNWQFNEVSKPSERPKEFPLPNFDASKWVNVRITEILKPDTSKINVTFPLVPHENNTVKSYRKVFPIPENWFGQQIFIRFDEIGAACYIWLNGKRVGYTETGYLGSEFNITPYVKFGRMNTLAVQTYKFSDGSWLFKNDSLVSDGIYGDVYLYSAPNLAIHDIKITSEMVNKNGHLKIVVDPKNSLASISGKFKLSLSLKDSEGKDIFPSIIKSFNPSRKSDSIIIFDQMIPVVKLWNPGDAYLYSVIIELKDKENQTIEAVSSKVGFRNIDIQKNFLSVNGILIDSDLSKIQDIPELKSLEEVKKFINSLKENKQWVIVARNNLTNQKYLDLFDANGICVIEEVPFSIDEKNILAIGKQPEWRQPVYLRVKKLVERDKNHPCIIKINMDEKLKGTNFDAAKKVL